MQSDLFGAPINEPVAPKKAPVSSSSVPVKQESTKDYSSHGAVLPYEWWRSGKNTTVIWNKV